MNQALLKAADGVFVPGGFGDRGAAVGRIHPSTHLSIPIFYLALFPLTDLEDL